MEKHEETRYVKRTQKDYTMSFKLQIIPHIIPIWRSFILNSGARLHRVPTYIKR